MDLTQNELDQIRTAMNAEIDRLLAARKPVVKQWPQVGDEYFYVSTSGAEDHATFRDISSERFMIGVGNVFKTRAEANRRVEALKVQADLRRMPGVEWAGLYGIGLSHNSAGFSATRSMLPNVSICGVWFSTKAQANAAIKTIGQERLQLWLDDYLQTPIGGE